MPLTQDQKDVIYLNLVEPYFNDITDRSSEEEVKDRISDIQKALFERTRVQAQGFRALRQFYRNLDRVPNGQETKQYFLNSCEQIIIEKTGHLNRTPQELGWQGAPWFQLPRFQLQDVQGAAMQWFGTSCGFTYL